MSQDDVTVFMSDSILDRVNMEQFYDDPDVKDINVTMVSNGNSISGRMMTFKLDTSFNSFLQVSFISTIDNVSNMMFIDSIEKISFTTEPGDKSIREFSDLKIISNKLDIDYVNNQCLYEFIVEIHNI